MLKRLAYTPAEAARLLGVSRPTVYAYIREARLRAVQPHGRKGGWLIPAVALDEFLAGVDQRATHPPRGDGRG